MSADARRRAAGGGRARSRRAVETTPLGGQPLNTLESLRSKLRRLTLLRIVLVSCLLAATAVLGLDPLAGGSERPKGVPHRFDLEAMLYGTGALVYLASAGYAVALRMLRTAKGLVRLGHIGLTGDALFAAILVLLTDGTGSVFTFFFSLTIVNAAILLYRPGALISATVCAVLFVLIGLDEMGAADLFPFAELGEMKGAGFGSVGYNLVINGVAFYAIALLASYLAEQLRRTDLKLEEKRHHLEDLRALHENIVASIQSGLVTVNESRQITYFNRVAERMTGFRRQDVLFRDITGYFKDLRAIFANEDKLQSRHSELTSQVVEGRVRALQWTISPLEDSRGRRIGHTLIFEDVTRVRAMEAEVKRAQQFATIGKLASVIAHEIRNPLASISGSIQLLRATLDLDEDDERLLTICARETDALSQWITDFLTYARPRKGERVPVELGRMMRDAVTVLKGDEHSAGVAIEVEVVSEAWVSADPTTLRQVVWNLLNNAVQAMPEGGTLSVAIGSSASDGDGPRVCRMTVRDTGVGIPPEIRERIFEPFFTTKDKGTGLGLPTVYRIVSEHGGALRVDSEVGVGTQFTVEMPEAAAIAPVVTTQRELEAVPPSKAESALAAEAQPGGASEAQPEEAPPEALVDAPAAEQEGAVSAAAEPVAFEGDEADGLVTGVGGPQPDRDFERPGAPTGDATGSGPVDASAETAEAGGAGAVEREAGEAAPPRLDGPSMAEPGTSRASNAVGGK